MRTPSPQAPQSSLLCKLAFFIALLPLFPSQAPRYLVGQTISAGIWELLRLLIVGIAVSYGLFSRRNLDSDFGNDPPPRPPKADAVRSFASDVLRVLPPAFDAGDEGEGATEEIGSGTGSEDDRSAALPSPIPWRSKSAKMEDIRKAKLGRSHSLPAMRTLSPSPSLPPEMQAKTNCDGNSAPQTAKGLVGEVAAAEESAKEVEEGEVRGGGGGKEVDKKAEEFIARFREEIRRQRIESIKSSTRQTSIKRPL